MHVGVVAMSVFVAYAARAVLKQRIVVAGSGLHRWFPGLQLWVCSCSVGPGESWTVLWVAALGAVQCSRAGFSELCLVPVLVPATCVACDET